MAAMFSMPKCFGDKWYHVSLCFTSRGLLYWQELACPAYRLGYAGVIYMAPWV